MTASERPVALITGGARGIGLATAFNLLGRGFRVAVADLDAPAEGDLAGLAQRSDLASVVVDVTDSASVDRMVARVIEMHGRLDGLINCAGYNRHQTVADLEDATWQKLVDVHLGGALRCCRAAHAALKRSSQGAVVNFSSIAAHVGRPRRAPYSAAKAGLEAMTRTLAVEWAADNIRVNAVAPGVIWTRMVEDNIKRGAVDRDSLIRNIPLARFGTAEEIASAVGFLISREAAYVTGQTLVVDGGATINGNW
ncbi:MAG: SDR family oxidoreductase [Alphaproteobacteria bacterium]|nr:SDR family oxidoreductase [Alphaproteobacteria bacterium]